MFRINKNHSAFTIVELLVVIVVIGILAAITIVSYTGISQKATTSTLQSDLNSASKKLKMYQIEYGAYPVLSGVDVDGNYCPTAPVDTKYCIRPTTGNTFIYSSTSPYSNFILDAKNTSTGNKYRITNNAAPVSALSSDTITIGYQIWLRYNLDVGTRINVATAQINNSTLEKWCYNDLDINCSIYGGLYQWGETVQYLNGASNTTSPSPVFSGNIQGICPIGFHLPTDIEYKTLEIYLGMTQIQADALNWRGNDQGTQLKFDGSSGWNGMFGGYGRNSLFNRLDSYGYFWTSTQDDASYSTVRSLSSSESPPQVFRTSNNKTYGFSVRCIKD